MTERVLVIGEALIDMVTRDGAAPEEHVGGSPANVALGLGRLGVPVRLRTALARDARGERIAAHLAASGVDVEPQSFVLSRTSTAAAHLSSHGDARYEFDIEWRIDAPIRIGDARIVHVGSIGCFIEPGASAVIDAVRAVSGRARVTFDPNIRAELIGDRDAAARIVRDVASVSEVVKLSDEDAAYLYPGATADQVIDTILAFGPRVVAMTRGAQGAVLSDGAQRIASGVPPVAPVDTVGAGDSFMAALVASLAEDGLADLRAAGDRAALAAAVTVSRAGADLPYREELPRQ